MDVDLTCDEEMLPEEETPLEALNHSMEEADGEGNFNHNAKINATLSLSIIEDPRVLKNMLELDECHLPSPNYFKMVQTEVTPDMRQSLASWMYEVCEAEDVPEAVFLRSVNYVDRYLSVEKIPASELQLLGATCMFISSKWSGSPLSAELLVFYTAHSITCDQLVKLEMNVLTKLRWDSSSVVASDFVDILLYRLPKDLWDAKRIRDKIRTFIAICACDPVFLIRTPSLIASASIVAALVKLVSQKVFQEICSLINSLTNIDTDVLKGCMDQILLMVDKLLKSTTEESRGSIEPNSVHLMSEETLVLDKLEELEQAETPTDVRDIHFYN